MALPTLRPVKHPRYAWRITYTDQTRRTPAGRPREFHRYFKQDEEAEARRTLAEMGGIVAEQGLAGLQLSPTLRRDALDARAKLDAAGFAHISLVAAADRFLGSQATGPAARQLVTPFLDQFLDHKSHEEGVRAMTRDNLEDRVGRWLDWQSIVTLADITPERCLALRTRSEVSAQTRKNDMNAVSSFLSYLAQEAKVITHNPLLGQRRPRVERQRPQVYLPQTCQRILDAAASYEGGRHARAVGLLFLAGLRPSEVPHALIRTDARPAVVRVEGGKMRGRANRVVPLSPEGAAWLAAQPAKIVPPTTGERRQICKLAGGVAWIQDGARHTWISARCEIEQNDGRVARMAGTSERIIHAHYHALMNQRTARAVERLGLPRAKRAGKTKRYGRVRPCEIGG
jgi:integrase